MRLSAPIDAFPSIPPPSGPDPRKRVPFVNAGTRAFWDVSCAMSESITQHESHNNLASLLRLVAETLRLFSDTEADGGDYICPFASTRMPRFFRIS